MDAVAQRKTPIYWAMQDICLTWTCKESPISHQAVLKSSGDAQETGA